jgi:hypothetical protein
MKMGKKKKKKKNKNNIGSRGPPNLCFAGG